MVAAAARGEHSAMFTFDESVNSMLTRSQGLGFDVPRHIDEGMMTVSAIDPAELSPGEFTQRIREAAEVDGARVIVIDSLNGYLNAMPEERFMVVQLHELLAYLGQLGVVTVLVSAQQGLIGAMANRVDVSYLADGVILFRYFESRGSVRQAISVLNKAHRLPRAHDPRVVRQRHGPAHRRAAARIPRGTYRRPARARWTAGAAARAQPMSDVPAPAHEQILLLLPTHSDSRLTAEILRKNGIAAIVCDGPGHLSRQLSHGAAAVLVSEESLAQGAQAILMQAVERQPRWSDLPVLVLTRSGANSQQVGEAIEQLGNVTVLERPLRLAALVSAVRTALRARQRQYQIRTHLDELEAARDDQARSARHKDEFLAMLAHELRNPLAPIRNALRLLGTSGETAGSDEGVRAMMARQVDHMVRLVDDLVDVSRLSRGTIELRRERVEMGSMLRNAVELSRPLLDAGQHQLDTVMPDDPLWVDVDPVRIAQVFGNLLNNAAKYATPNGHITLSVLRSGDEAVVSVRDRGIGIEPEMLPHVFELFTQGRRDAHRAQDGLGIGLTLVRSLVEMHGGTVTASSEGFGRGSEFVVRLPLASGIAAPSPGVLTGATPTASAAGQFAGLRVLVVDDNVDAAMSLGMVMELLGIDHEVLFSGQGALDRAGRFLPHAILLDIGMPGMDGYEVARRLRLDPRLADTTLVALTGWSQVQDQQRAREAGFDHHFSKPADIGALQRLLVTLVPTAPEQRPGSNCSAESKHPEN